MITAMRNEEQKELMQWLCRMEEIAVRSNVKTRLLDAIADCKRDLSSGLSGEEKQKKIRELGALLEQMKKQTGYEPEEGAVETEIRQKATEMRKRCRHSNKILKRDFQNGTGAYILEAERSMNDMCNVSGNYEEVTQPERFFNLFAGIGQKFKRQMNEFQREYIAATDQNYQNLLERLRALFSSTGRDPETQRKFYSTYYENQESLIRNVQGYADNLEKGEGVISEYAQKLNQSIQKIMRRRRRKASRQKWLPFVIILLIVALGITGRAIRIYREEAEGTAQTTESGDDGPIEKLQMHYAEFLMEKGEELTGAVVKVVTWIMAVLTIGIPVFILFLVLYRFWIRRADRRCRDQIIEDTGRVQRAAFEEWKQSKKLQTAVEESFRLIEAFMEKQYGDLLSALWTDEKETDAQRAEFVSLCADWETIRRKAGL